MTPAAIVFAVLACVDHRRDRPPLPRRTDRRNPRLRRPTRRRAGAHGDQGRPRHHLRRRADGRLGRGGRARARLGAPRCVDHAVGGHGYRPCPRRQARGRVRHPRPDRGPARRGRRGARRVGLIRGSPHAEQREQRAVVARRGTRRCIRRIELVTPPIGDALTHETLCAAQDANLRPAGWEPHDQASVAQLRRDSVDFRTGSISVNSSRSQRQRCDLR